MLVLVLFFQVAGLIYGAKYNYRVFAENAAGISNPSNIIGPLLADDAHGQKPSLTLALSNFNMNKFLKRG